MQATGRANGPEVRTDWTAGNGRKAGRVVRNLRRRIFRAAPANDRRRVGSLQKLMLRSYAPILMRVRRVTQVNAGKNTPGVDKVVVKTATARGRLVDPLTTFQPCRAKPVLRGYIPKRNGKLRPRGIPTVRDRCLPAAVKNALEPYGESQFEGSRYGFRPGRSCQDAIANVYRLARPPQRKKGVVDADRKGALDNLNPAFLLRPLGDVPGRQLLRRGPKP